MPDVGRWNGVEARLSAATRAPRPAPGTRVIWVKARLDHLRALARKPILIDQRIYLDADPRLPAMVTLGDRRS